MTSAFQVICEDFVDRAPERRVLTTELEAAARGDGRTIVLAGEAGIGKSRLVLELKSHATRLGSRVIEGRCSSAESDVAYAPFMDALRFRLERGEGRTASRLLGPLVEHLAPLFPQLDAAAASPEEPSGERVFERIFQVVERLSGLDPLLLIIEDIHWADSTSLELINYLSGRIRSTRTLLVCTCRSDEVDARAPAKRLLQRLGRERRARQLSLEPLPQEDVSEMIRCITKREPSEGFARAVFTRSEGNPYFVEELMASITDWDLVASEDVEHIFAQLELPSTIRDLVVGRFDTLGDAANEVLAVAAVIGRSFTFELLSEASGVSEAKLLKIVEQLVTRHVLVETQIGAKERYSFRHLLTREAIYGSIILRRRRLLHRRVAEALERQPEDVTAPPYEVLAYHYRLAGDDERAAKYALLAGNLARRLHAWEDATAHYERALAALENTTDDRGLQAETLEKLFDCAWWLGRMDVAEQYALEALHLRQAERNTARIAVLLRRLAELYADHHGELDRAAAFLGDALRVLQEGPASVEAALSANNLARIYIARGDFALAESLLVKGLRVAGGLGEHGEEALALALLGQLAIAQGQVAAGNARLDVALEVLRDSPLPFERSEPVYRGGVHALLAAREDARAGEWIQQALEHAHESGASPLGGLYRVLQAVLAGRRGETTALDDARRAVDDLRHARRPETREALRALGYLLRVRGDITAAKRAYEEALELGERHARLGLAIADLAAGEPRIAAAEFERILGSRPSGDRMLRLHVLPMLIEALVADGRGSEAETCLATLAEAVSETDLASAPASLAACEGMVLTSQGDLEKGARAFERAAEHWERVGDRREAARARLAHAEAVLLSTPGSEPAVDEAKAALAEFERLGAQRELDRARAVLRRVGVRVRKRGEPAQRVADAERSSLTRRESMVLGELAKGATNREIAVALGIAEKTVGVHLAHIYAKLGCRTRTQALAMLRDTGTVIAPV